jgi:exonuclease VII large subunit
MRPAQSAISVSELNRQVKALLEQGLAKLWVEGEISNDSLRLVSATAAWTHN